MFFGLIGCGDGEWVDCGLHGFMRKVIEIICVLAMNSMVGDFVWGFEMMYYILDEIVCADIVLHCGQVGRSWNLTAASWVILKS